eukprot:scaffold139961_cov37-Prasinocladus_malaysianus.AAC.1
MKCCEHNSRVYRDDHDACGHIRPQEPQKVEQRLSRSTRKSTNTRLLKYERRSYDAEYPCPYSSSDQYEYCWRYASRFSYGYSYEKS